MDFNYDFNKNLSKELRIKRQDEKPETEHTEELKKDEPSANLRIPTSRKVTADATAIDATIRQALLKGQTVKPEVTGKEKVERGASNEGGNNPFVAATSEDDITVDGKANNIFSSVTNGTATEDDPAITANGGIGAFNDDLADLKVQWYNLPSDASYEAKMNLIGRIILAAQHVGNDKEVGTWSCYRYILRNNYLKEQYNNYLQQLANGVPYEDLGWNEQPWEISAYMSPEDQEDWEIFHDELHFGGEYELIEGSDPPAYNYTAAPPEQAYVYCNAMIARYSTKILAIQVKLQDPDIINNSTLTNKLNKDIAYYRQLLQGMIEERNRLAEELKLGYTEPNGAFHFYGDNGLVPGLTPPENNTPIHNEDDLQTQFEALETEYHEAYGNTPPLKDDPVQLAKAMELQNFAQKMVDKGEDLDYWQPKLNYWQNVLEQLQNGN